MAKKKVEEKVQGVNPEQLKAAALARLEKVYGQQLADKMGKLHNRLVGYISQAQIPLPHVVLVLEMLKDEAMELARQEYMPKMKVK